MVINLFAVTLFSLFSTSVCQTANELNVSAYLGRWYQVYSDLIVDATFENSSYCDTADYSLYPNGTISVLNRERQYSVTGVEREIFGWAQQTNISEPGQLEVHLQTTWFGAPYWIYELGPQTYNESMYEYSIVSDPFKATLFVLARNVSEFYEKWDTNVSTTLKNLGFVNFYNKPIETIQTNCTYWSS